MKIIVVYVKNFSGTNFTNSNLLLGPCKRAERHIDGTYGEASWKTPSDIL